MKGPPFVPWGADHLISLLAVAATAGALSLLGRRDPAAAALIRRALAGLLLALTLTYIAVEIRTPGVTIWSFVPLHLCDMAIFIAVYALLTRHQGAYEVLYFWSLTGTLLAMVTPDVHRGFPDWQFLTYFVLHGGVVVAAVFLTVGEGLRPRRTGPLRAFGWLCAYAGVVAVVNLVFDTNFLYLRYPPGAPTLLDWFGPWPWYLVGAATIAVVAFWLLALPFRR